MARILLADPTVIHRVEVVKALEEDGHRVEETPNGREALDMCRNAPPALLITELVLQGMDGFKLIRGLKEENIGVPVLVLTDVRMKDIEERVKALGAAGFMRKPAQPLKLAEFVATLVKSTKTGEDEEPPPSGGPIKKLR